MKRKFITNLAFLLFLNLLVKPFWTFGIDIAVQNEVGSSDYGFYFSLFSFSLLLNIILDIGITNYNNRNIAQHPDQVSKTFSNIFVLRLLLGVIYTILCLGAGFIIGYNQAQFKMLYFLILNQFLAQLILYFRSNISGLLFLRTDSILSVLDRTLMIIVCSLLLWGKITKSAFRIEWFVYAQTFTYTLTTIIVFIVVRSKIEYFKPKIDFKYLFFILKQSFPFALLILLMILYNRIDSVMLERLLTDGKTQAGIYAQAFRILDAFAQYSLLFAGLLLPIFSSMLKKKESIEEMVQLASMLLLVPAIILALSSSLFSDEIMNVLYKEHTGISSKVFGLMILGFIGISTTYIFGTLLTANGNLKELNIMAASAVVLNIVLNFILIPRYKALGSACVSVTVQTLTALAQTIMAVRILKIRINSKLLTGMAVFVILLLGSGILLHKYLSKWVIAFFMILVLGFVIALLLRLLKIKDYLQIIRFGDDYK